MNKVIRVGVKSAHFIFECWCGNDYGRVVNRCTFQYGEKVVECDHCGLKTVIQFQVKRYRPQQTTKGETK